MLASCLYEGTLHHARLDPRREFTHRLALAYIDLEELPRLLDGRLSARSPGLVRFRRDDYLGDPRLDLDRAVRELVEQRLGRAPTGPIRLLTHLRSFGHCFNPVSFYYCLDAAAEHVEALVAEVTNTPWGERHAYVVPGGAGRLDKALHVSPFMGPDLVYDCETTMPGARLAVRISSSRQGRPVFGAGLALSRRELTPAAVRREAVRYPLGTIRVLALIYAHALGLHLAGVPAFAHPRRAAA